MSLAGDLDLGGVLDDDEDEDEDDEEDVDLDRPLLQCFFFLLDVFFFLLFPCFFLDRAEDEDEDADDDDLERLHDLGLVTRCT